MNITYLIILAAITLYTVIQIATDAFDSYNFFRFSSTFISLTLSIIGLFLSFVAPFGEMKYEYYPATNTRVGNQFIIQSEVQTLIETDIKFENMPVKIKKNIFHNAWGLHHSETFSTTIQD